MPWRVPLMFLWRYDFIACRTILPPYLKRMLFWTAARSPKLNFDFLFLEKYLSQSYIFILLWKYFSIQIYSYGFCIYFETQQLESYSWFIFLMFDPNLVQNDILFEYGGSILDSWYHFIFSVFYSLSLLYLLFFLWIYHQQGLKVDLTKFYVNIIDCIFCTKMSVPFSPNPLLAWTNANKENKMGSQLNSCIS